MRPQYAQTGQDAQAPQPMTGLHQGVSEFWTRLDAANSGLEGILARLRGSQPQMENGANAKNPETPHIRMVMTDLGSEISRYENNLNELANLIG